MKFSLGLLALPSLVSGTVYFKESFNDDSYEKTWTQPASWKPKGDMGAWQRTEGQWHGGDTSLQTSENARFYGFSAPLTTPVDNDGKDLVVQYTVKHEQRLDCGGAYIKLLRGGDKFDADKFGGDSEYGIMFGPDICGSATRRTHVIFTYKGENKLIEKDVRCETDQLSHLYTLHLKSDNTFDVLIDNKSVRSGSLEDEFKFLEPKEIEDPAQSKPDDWVDERRIPDPDDEKPEGYDDVPAEIPDPEASKPEDWDNEDDGEWEAPMVKNPDYKGAWKPKMIDNPDYKGPWEHPKIANPEYVADPKLYQFCGGDNKCTHVGFELWQVTAGTSFDDIIVTDSIAEAQAFAEETFFKKQDKEKKLYDDVQEKEREEAQRKADEEAMKAKAKADEEEDLSHDEF